MVYMLVRHKVKDYAKWKPIFDQHGATRRAGGSRGATLFRSHDNPNEIVILFEWTDATKARQFADSKNLRETMERAGVVNKPDVVVLDSLEKVPV